MSETTFTEKQIADWHIFEGIRKKGKFNMLDASNARKGSRLSAEEYLFCLRNYSSMKRAIDARAALAKVETSK